MKSLFISLIAIPAIVLTGTASCNSQGNTGSAKKDSPAKTATKKSTAKFNEGSDYTLFTRARVLDKTAFDKPVEAFSLLIPKDWQFSGDIIWTMPGSPCAGTNRTFKTSSPDGKYSLEIFPDYTWGFTTNQQLAQFNRNNTTKYCGYGEPLDATQYVKQVFLPQEAGNPQIEEIRVNEPGRETIGKKAEKYRSELMSYGASQVQFYPSAITAKVKWNDGSEGMVLCGIITGETTLANPYDGSYSKSYITSTSEKVLFRYPSSESAKAEKLLSVMLTSMCTSDAWKGTVENYWKQVREQKQAVHLNKIRMMDDYTRQIGANAIKKGQENLNNMDANMRSWEARQQSQDQMHTSFIKAIREVENYRDETGKVELSSGYNHAWSRSDGSSFIMTDNPNFDPSSVFLDPRWKEMKKVND